MPANSSISVSPSSSSIAQPIQFSHQINTTLSSDNFLLWKLQVQPVLRGHGLMPFLDGSKVIPDAFLESTNGARTPNPEHERWLRQDQLILAWIFNSLSTQILAQVVNCDTSAQVWRQLHHIYNSQSLAKIMELKFLLQTIRKGNDTCAQYLQRIQSIADNLRSVGSAISDQDLILQTLHGLGTEFESFVTAITMRQEPVSMPELHNLLLAHEARNRLQNQTTVMMVNQQANSSTGTSTPVNAPLTNSDTSHQALASQYMPRQQSGTYQGRGRRGGYRGRGRGRQSNNTREDVYCQICTKWGHPAYKCHHRFDITYTGPTPTSSTQVQQNSSVQPHQALLAEPTVSDPVANWFLDSGASTHVTPELNNLSSHQVYTGSDRVYMGNGEGLSITHTGSSFISLPHMQLKLNNVLCVPKLTKNLLSISQLTQDNPISVEFTSNSCFVKDLATQKVILHGSLCNGLYALHTPPQHQVHHLSQSNLDIWHSKLAHCSLSVIKALQKSNRISVLGSQFSECSDCNRSKAHKLPFFYSNFEAVHPLHVIHTDVWGPAPVLSHSGNKYYVLFTDQFSRFSWLYCCSVKSDVCKIFTQFRQKAENLLSNKIKIVQCDGGTEFKPIQSQFPDITFHISCPYTPEQNGLVERKHRHIVELSLASMYHAAIPLEYWDTVFESTLFVINRLPTTVTDMKSPFEKLFHTAPDYQFLHTLGCECFPLLRPYNQHKLQPRSESCVFMGYSALHKGYKCLHIPSQRTYISRHVKFNETVFPFSKIVPANSTKTAPTTTAPLTIIPIPVTPQTPPPHKPTPTAAIPSTQSTVMPSSTNTHIPIIPPSAPTSKTIPTTSKHSMTTRSRTNNLKPKQFPHHKVLQTTKYPLTISTSEPTCYTQAVKTQEWRQAMANELDALAKNNTWQLVDPPLHANIIGCKWLFKIKKRADGTVERYKARLVAKGYNQEEGLDYFETFSPVVKPTTIRIVLTIALSQGWHIHQLDVNNAFLHGDLDETILMQQPPGFVDSLHPNKVCLLRKALYGLKQAPRAWFHKLKEFLLTHKFVCSQSDNSLFVFRSKSTVLFLLVYVDDIVITGNDTTAISSLLSTLQTAFSIKDLGQINYFLGIQVSVTDTSLCLNQSQYISSILQKTHMEGAKPCKTPMQAGLQLSKFSGIALSDPQQYRMIVGALQYATITRPDIAFAVNKVAQFMAQPTDVHWQAVKRILRYLKGTITKGLLLTKSTHLTLTAYTDADWAGCPDERKSTTGYAIFLGNNLVSWSSKKQATVARSSTEAEYRSMAMAAAEIIWIQSLLHELGVKSAKSPILWCDNLGATFLAANPVFHARTKHIELDFHFIREQVASKKLNIQFLCSTDQLADVLTKPLPSTRFLHLCSKLTVVEDPLRLRGDVEMMHTDKLDNSSSDSNTEDN
ncbi:hypothetical protein LUZ61_005055 [Rhynchospora tenuis]|uniref:Integrase catalytic domain-containing protein n=1 Tax=Rhynchospora tenuis TaxID=198213 RepID=A0AAD6EUE1_9POAL|nr:hypothetical protein LUZ61_005055 [Rhynchospora tenuis]